jgi:hypothetical protein
MKRIPIFIDDDVDDSIRQLAAEDGRPFMALIREALFEYVQQRGIALKPRVREPQTMVDDPEIRDRMRRTLQNIHDSIQTDLSPEEIEQLITEVSEEMRDERMASQLARHD